MANILNEINKIKLANGREYTLMPPDGSLEREKFSIEVQTKFDNCAEQD